MNRPVVIINPVSSGAELGPAFSIRGVPPIAVRLGPSSGQAGFANNINGDHYERILDNNDDLLSKLSEIGPRAIIPGSEGAVPLADKLATKLTPDLANISKFAHARIHKGAMQEALAQAGLPVIPTLDTASTEQVAKWLSEKSLEESPLIVKPPASAGSDCVFHISPRGDWRTPFQHILDTPAKLQGRINETVIVQEQVDGVEFCVDTVSANGRHELAHLIRYAKTIAAGRKTIFDYTEFVPFDLEKYGELVEYTYRALDALGIRWGAAHTEVMLTSDGPRLIETGARMCGGPVLEFSRAATGSSQLERVVESYLDGSFSTPKYELRQTVVPVFLAAPVTGEMQNVEILDELAGLPTHLATKMWHRNGDMVRQTVDFDTTMGIIALAGDRDAVFDDYKLVREIESRLIIRPKQRR